jgi:hypothetical protein
MGENAEMQIGIFVKNLPLGLHIRPEMLGNEVRIGTSLGSVLADNLSTARPRILQ